MTTTTIKSRAREIESVQAGIDAFTKGSIISMGVVSGAAGLWAVACLISAVAGSGLTAVTQGLFTALTGM